MCMRRCFIIASGVYLLLIGGGCGPIKGYPGPEVPATRLVTVTTSSSEGIEFSRVRIDGIHFSPRSIQVLPGEHTIHVLYSARSESRNCGMDREYDNNPQQRSAEEERCQKKNPDNSSLCTSSWMTEKMELKCDYLRTSYDCLLQGAIEEPGVYTVSVHSTGEILELSGRQKTLRFECLTTDSRWQREKMG